MTENQIREQFFASRNALAALEARTVLVDEIVRNRWKGLPDNVALVATGGYGRRELFPCSDIDLLILTPDLKTQDQLREPLGIYLRDLWDAGLRVSQSVHTPADCNQIEASNIELAVSLLDRRLLAGNAAVFQQVRDPKAELSRDIARLTRERHARFQDTIYHLEPNVKDAPGGMRDLQVLRWLAKLGVVGGDLPAGIPVLFEIRCFLHYIAGRDENKLSFERQDEIAALTGADSPEALMRQYYRAVTGISRVAGRRLERCEEKRSGLFAQFRDRSARYSNTEFTVVHGKVFFRVPQLLEHDPGLILNLFEFTARHGLPLAIDTEERIERNAQRFAMWVSTHQPLWPRIRTILRLPSAPATLRDMHSVGILEGLFPELHEITALVIRDFYHRYTVDEHTLVAIRNVAALRDLDADAFGDLLRETEEVDLLFAALLFHDVGKADAFEGHVESSAVIAGRALLRCGMSDKEFETVRFLIRSHLLLSATMNGRDVSDPATAKDVAGKTGTVERLKLLTLLTYADISAVNPSAMTPWRRQLLWTLHTEADAALTRELGEKSEKSAETVSYPEWDTFLAGLPSRYLRTHSREEIAVHAGMAPEALSKGVAVALRHDTAHVLTVVAKDQPFLFASVAGSLSSFGFNILKAEAFTNAQGLVVDTFSFADPSRNLDLNPEISGEVLRTVSKAVRGEVKVEQLLKRRPLAKPDVYAMQGARASFDNTASPVATLIQLVTQDRPGLLFDVASVISQHEGNIEVVLVDTEARKAIDVFYVTHQGAKLSDGEAIRLTEAIKDVIGVR